MFKKSFKTLVRFSISGLLVLNLVLCCFIYFKPAPSNEEFITRIASLETQFTALKGLTENAYAMLTNASGDIDKLDITLTQIKDKATETSVQMDLITSTLETFIAAESNTQVQPDIIIDTPKLPSSAAISASTSILPEENHIEETTAPESQNDIVSTEADLSIKDANQQRIVKTGDQVIVKISAEHVSDLYGYQFELHFDNDDFKYEGGLSSSISEINTIFAKEIENHLLIGATKIGDEKGFSEDQAVICEIILTAKRECEIPNVSITNINIVKSDLTYAEGIKNWSVDTQI